VLRLCDAAIELRNETLSALYSTGMLDQLNLEIASRRRNISAADRLRRWRSFRRLWAVQTIAHSARTFWKPRSRNWRNPRACLICPNTGSGSCLRNR
jgi:hypothetical protein